MAMFDTSFGYILFVCLFVCLDGMNAFLYLVCFILAVRSFQKYGVLALVPLVFVS